MLASLTYHNVVKGHPFWSMYQCFISFYYWIMFHSIDNTNFIYPYLSWLTFRLFSLFGYGLWLMHLWTSLYRFLGGYTFLFLFNIYLGEELLGHMVTLFWGIVKLFSKALHHFAFSPAMYVGFTFSTVSPTLVFVSLFYYSHPCGCEVVSYYGFCLHFPDA